MREQALMLGIFSNGLHLVAGGDEAGGDEARAPISNISNLGLQHPLQKVLSVCL